MCLYTSMYIHVHSWEPYLFRTLRLSFEPRTATSDGWDRMIQCISLVVSGSERPGRRRPVHVQSVGQLVSRLYTFLLAWSAYRSTFSSGVMRSRTHTHTHTHTYIYIYMYIYIYIICHARTRSKTGRLSVYHSPVSDQWSPSKVQHSVFDTTVIPGCWDRRKLERVVVISIMHMNVARKLFTWVLDD